jgi:hypothetical protein
MLPKLTSYLHLHLNNKCGSSGCNVLTINAWNTENADGESTNSFDCDANAELYRYFLRQEPIPVLLLIDKQATWNQELENVYLISCETVSNDNDGNNNNQYNRTQHYEYELRPADDQC